MGSTRAPELDADDADEAAEDDICFMARRMRSKADWRRPEQSVEQLEVFHRHVSECVLIRLGLGIVDTQTFQEHVPGPFSIGGLPIHILAIQLTIVGAWTIIQLLMIFTICELGAISLYVLVRSEIHSHPNP